MTSSSSSQAPPPPPHYHNIPKSKRGPRQPNYKKARIRRRRSRILAWTTPGSGSYVTGPWLAHLVPRHSKSLTSRPARGGPDLDPIQRLPRTAQGRSGTPGQNDRRYGNQRRASALRPSSTRTPRGPLSPEARSCAARGAAGWCRTGCTRVPVGMPRGVPRGYTPGHATVTLVHPRTAPPPPHRALRKNGPLGSMASRGAPLREHNGNTREYTGIHGILSNNGNTREYTEYTG